MKLVVLAKCVYLAVELVKPVRSLKILFLLVAVVCLLELDIGGTDGLL